MAGHHTREVLGLISRWGVLIACGAALTVAVAHVLTGLSHTLAVAGGWSAAPDFVASLESYLRFRVKSSVPDRPGMPRFYWRGLRGMILRPWSTQAGAFRLDLTGGRPVDHFIMEAVPNPYGGHVPTGRVGSVYSWPTDTELLLLDARSILAYTEDGELARTAEGRWTQTSSAVPLAELSGRRPLLYLVTGPLSQYDAARRVLQRAPAGPVLAAATEWELPATHADVVAAAKDIRRYLRRGPLLVTENAELAAYAAAGGLDVACVGAAPGEGGGAQRLADWEALLKRLSPQQ